MSKKKKKGKKKNKNKGGSLAVISQERSRLETQASNGSLQFSAPLSEFADTGALIGSQDLSSELNSFQRQYNLEIIETPIRNPPLATELIEIKEHSYVARAVLRQALRDTFSSHDGSDRGFTISDTLADGETPCDPDVLAVVKEVLGRRNHDYMILGGDRCGNGLTEALVAGNGYMELGIELEGITKNDFGIAQTQYLPTWQMFKIRTDQGQTIGFEQRRSLSEEDPIQFPLWKIAEFTHDLDNVYGRSLWHPEELRKSWTLVKQASEDAGITSHETANNPNVHTMPPDTSRRQRKQYKDSYNQRKKGRIITDHFLPHGMTLGKLNPNPSDTLTPALENLMYRRIEMIPPGIPLFYFPEFSRFLKGARDLSNQPAMNYSRLRHSWCQIVAKGARQAIDVELILRLGREKFYELNKQYFGNMYVLQFPVWSILDAQTSSQNQPYDDLENDEDGDDTLEGAENDNRRLASV